MSRHTALYRLYGADGTALYIGISGDWRKRLVQHYHASPWATDTERIEVDWYATRLAAELAERDAIRAEQPRWNWDYTKRDARHKATQ